MAAAVAAAGSILAGALPAYAQSPVGMQQAQAARTANYNIPAQPLAQALTALGQQAGLQLAVSAPVIAGKTSSAVSGVMTAEQALQQLLAGTGVSYRFTSPSSVTVTGAPDASGALQLDAVQVQGYPVPPQALIDNLPPPYAGGQVATGGQLGLLGNRPVMDTPFNQTSYTAKKIQDQQARTVFDVLVDNPSVRPASSDLTLMNGSAVKIRGFSAYSANVLYGGLYGMLPYYSTMTELAERVELLNGPSAMLNGMMPLAANGGVINVVPKRAPEQTMVQFTADYTSNALFGGHVDLGHRFGADKELGVRFNGVFRAGETPVQWTTDKRSLASLGLDYRGERVRLAADLGYQYQYVGGALPEIGLATGVPLPWAWNSRTNQGGPWGYLERKDAWAVLRGEFDVTERITLYAAAGARDERNVDQVVRNFSITGVNGDATAAPQNLSFYYQNYTATAGVRGIADTGIINHEFNVNATAVKQILGAGYSFGQNYATNIYNPTYLPSPDLPTPAANLSSITSLNSLAFADTLSLVGKRIQLTAGARLQQVASTNYNRFTGEQTASYDQSALTPSVALVVKPFWENVSFYGNWIQGLQQGTVVSATYRNAGEVFPPYVTNQYEVGVKVDWGRLTTTASLFQISQPSTIVNVATNTLFVGGEQRNQGLELNFFGELLEGVRVLGGAMFLSGVLTRTQGGLTDGWVAPFAPGAQFNLAGEWDLPFARGLTAVGRFTYTGSQYIDATWPRRSVPEWTRLDIGARYTFERPGPTGKPVTLRLNVENVLDNNYWNGTAVDSLMVGAPRTFRLALTSDF